MQTLERKVSKDQLEESARCYINIVHLKITITITHILTPQIDHWKNNVGRWRQSTDDQDLLE